MFDLRTTELPFVGRQPAKPVEEPMTIKTFGRTHYNPAFFFERDARLALAMAIYPDRAEHHEARAAARRTQCPR